MTLLEEDVAETAMHRAFELARAAADAGDGPYGTVLVHDGDIIMEERNEVRSSGDLAAHPELTIARRVARACDEETAAAASMVTSNRALCDVCKGNRRYEPRRSRL